MSRPIVLLHGSPGAPNAWKGVIKALGEDVTVITPGLPDHNQPHPPQRRETAEMAATIVDALGPQPDGIVLAAHSYGGNVALQIALAGKVKVAALVLIEPVALAILPVLGEEAAYRRSQGAVRPLRRESPRRRSERGRHHDRFLVRRRSVRAHARAGAGLPAQPDRGQSARRRGDVPRTSYARETGRAVDADHDRLRHQKPGRRQAGGGAPGGDGEERSPRRWTAPITACWPPTRRRWRR